MSVQYRKSCNKKATLQNFPFKIPTKNADFLHLCSNLNLVLQLFVVTMNSPDYSDSDESSTCSSEGGGAVVSSPLPKMTDLGKRVIFPGSDKKSKYGVLRFVGETEFAEGMWCGVELDQAAGKNNGSVHGIRYFTCNANYGVFVPIAKLELDASRRSRSRPNSQPSSRATSVERKEPPSRPNSAKSASGSVPVISVSKAGMSMQQELVSRLSLPLRRTSHPVNAGSSRRQPMKAFATNGVSRGDAKVREEKKPLAPFRSGGMYKAASSENIRAMKDKEKTKSGGQKLSQGMLSKKSSSERDLRNAGKLSAPGSERDLRSAGKIAAERDLRNAVKMSSAGSIGKTTDPMANKVKWKQLRTKSSSDILDDPNPASSTSSSTSHTSLESWPRISTPGNRDDLTPDGCSSPEDSHENLSQHTEMAINGNNGFVDSPEESPVQLTTKSPPTAALEEAGCDSTDTQGLANHVTRFTAQASSSPTLIHQSVPAPDNGHTHKYYKNRPSGTATLDHPLTSALIKDGGAKLLNQLLGPDKSVSFTVHTLCVEC